MDSLLRVQNISKSFLLEGKSVLVLNDISFDVKEHELITIIGPSGCGKSTLLELIAGITSPDGGQIFKHDTNITGRAGFAGYMPQDDLLLPWQSLIQNAILPCRIQHKDIKAAKVRAEKLLPNFGLTGFGDYKPYQLSGGMKQRAAFLRTVMCDAELLLLDEPFANLDALTRIRMQKWLLSVKEELGQTIIFVTHDIDEAIRISDTIYVMDNSPGPFIAKESVPHILKEAENDVAHPLWTQLKADLTAKLIK